MFAIYFKTVAGKKRFKSLKVAGQYLREHFKAINKKNKAKITDYVVKRAPQ